MKPTWHKHWRLLAVATDVVFIAAILVGWTAARFGPAAVPAAFVPAGGREFGRAPLAFAIPVWVGVFAALRLYNPQRSLNPLQEARSLVTGGLASGVALVMLGFLVKENPARSWLVGGMVFGTLSAAIGRKTMRDYVSRLREAGRWMTPTIVVGRRQAKIVIDSAFAEPAAGILPVGVCGTEWPAIPAFGLGSIGEAVRATGASTLLVVGEDLERHEVAAAIEVADELPVQLIILPGLDHMLLGSLQLVTIGREPGLSVERLSMHGPQAAFKRVVDIAAAAILLALTAPLMLVTALVIRLDSRGPAIFRQDRVGRAGSGFRTIKFRTMRTLDDATPNEPDVPEGTPFVPKTSDDPRVTRVGRFLRRSSIDELPQLWNVLRGDMSLVGPRPLALWEARALDLNRRLIVRPGLTGLWQVSGRSMLSPEERIRLDLVYVQNWNLLLDLSILLRTVPAVIGRRGAY